MGFTTENLEENFNNAQANYEKTRRCRYARGMSFHFEFTSDCGRVSVLRYPYGRCEVRAPLSFLTKCEPDKSTGAYPVLVFRTSGAIVDGKYDSNAEGEPWFARTFRTINEAKSFVFAAVRAPGRGPDVSANATKSRLIAAAPDLLAACKLALERIDPDSAREKNGKRPKDAAVLEDWAQEACSALRAAIAKAQG